MTHTNHPEPHVAYMAGIRLEYLQRNPCVHLILYAELFRRASEHWSMIRHLRRKASEILERDAREALGIVYEEVDEFITFSATQLEAMLDT